MGSGCGSVGRGVASDTRGPRFESSHGETYTDYFFTVLKRRKQRKRVQEWPIFKINLLNLNKTEFCF